MNKLFAAALLVAVAGCGGGGGYSTPSSGSSTPAPAATSTASPASVLQTMTLNGSAGFVATNGRTVYVLSSDSFNSSTCKVASGCTGLWPVVAPPSGTVAGNGWTVFARSDGSGNQLAFNGWPLYTYSGDSASGQTNGNGINSFGGVWSIARPAMSNAPGTPGPTAPPTMNGGY